MKFAMDGRVESQMSILPQQFNQYSDVVECNSDGGTLIATCDRTTRRWESSIWYYSPDCDVKAFEDPKQCSSAIGIQTGVNDIVWISDKIFVGACDSGNVASWEVNNNEEPFLPLWEAREHDHLVSSLSFYEKQQRIISAGYDGRVKVWVLDDYVGECVETYKGHTDHIYSVDHHKIEPLFITCSRDRCIIVWDIRQPQPAQCYEKLTNGPVCARWRPNTDHSIVVGDSAGRIVVKDLRNPREDIRCFTEHNRAVNVLEFSPYCPDLLASGGEDCTVKVFDLDSESEKAVYKYDHNDYIRSITWRSASELLSCGFFGSVASHSGESWSHTMDVNGLRT